MLTPGKSGRDGKKIEYLQQDKEWRHFDKDLFDALRKTVVDDKDRRVASAETAAVLDPDVFSFHTETLKDDVDQRRDFFRKFLSLAEGKDLIFFDADIGLEVKGIRCGRKDSSKYLYLDELSVAFNKQHSIVIFQFYRQIKAEAVINQRTSQIFSCLDVNTIASFETPSVIFFLIPQPQHMDEMKERCKEIHQAWPGELCAVWHQRPDESRQTRP